MLNVSLVSSFFIINSSGAVLEIDPEFGQAPIIDGTIDDSAGEWIEAYKVGSTLLDHKVETADNVFKKEDYQTIMVAAVLPLVSKKVRGEISDEELKEKLKQLLDVLKNE